MDGAGLIRSFFALAAVWLAGNLAWLSADRLVRDGDEEGHVGAAELLVSILRDEGLLTFLATALAGELGEYPPLYPAAVAAWWALIGGQPGAVAVRAINLLSPLIAALCCGRIAEKLGHAGGPVAILVLLIPGVCGLSRHFMPEGMLIAAVSITALAALSAADRPDSLRAAALGAALGLGFLVKQTFVLYALPMALYGLWRLRIRGLLTAAVAVLLAGPWIFRNLATQTRYGAQSLQTADPGLLLTVSYYPIIGALTELAPLLTLTILAGLVKTDARSRRIIGLWVGLSLLLLIAVPRKYPRLLVPLLPLLCVWAAPVLTTRLRQGLLIGLAGSWLVIASRIPLPEIDLVQTVDDGCLQRWLRPPVADDFGLAQVSAAVRQREAAAVVVLDAPQIPCAVQTTHAWLDHLSPYLRRDGLDVPVYTEPHPGAVVVDWTGGANAVPLLQRSFSIR